MRRLSGGRERSNGTGERADRMEKEVDLLDMLHGHSEALVLGIRTHEFVSRSL